MAKFTPIPVQSFTPLGLGVMNANFNSVASVLEKVLSRDGASPNQMQSDLDLNHNDLLNVKEVSANVGKFDTIVIGDDTQVVPQGAEVFRVDSLPSLLASKKVYPLDALVITQDHGWMYKVVDSGEDVTTAGGVKLQATGDVLCPEQFGYTSGMSDCTTILNRMFTRGRAFRFDPSETYKIAGQIDTGTSGGVAKEFLGPKVRFEVAANASGSILVLRKIRANRIELHVPTGFTCPIAAVFRNGYIDVKEFSLTSDDQQVGYSGASQAAVRFDATDGGEAIHKIGSFVVKNFDRAAWVHHTVSQIDIDWVFIESCYRGIQTDMIDVIRLGGGIVYGNSPNKLPEPGHNALVLHGNHIQLGTFWSYDCGEHGFRFVAGNVGESETGGNISFQHLIAIRPGRTGVKFSSGTPSGETDTSFLNKITGDSIYVEDAGHANDPAIDATQYGDDGSGTPLDNDFGISIQRARDVNIGRFINKKRANNWAGRYGMKLESVRDMNIPHIHIEDTFNEALFIRDDFGDNNATGNTNLERWVFSDMYIRNCGNGGSTKRNAICLVGISETTRFMKMNGVVLDCPGILDVSISGSGSFAQPCFFSFRYRNLTGTAYVSDGTYSLIFRDFQPLGSPTAAVYTGGSSTNTDFPIGTVLVAKVTGTEPARNGIVSPYQHTSENCYTTNSTNSTGSQLTGTWRWRGTIKDTTDGSYGMIQRTA